MLSFDMSVLCFTGGWLLTMRSVTALYVLVVFLGTGGLLCLMLWQGQDVVRNIQIANTTYVIPQGHVDKCGPNFRNTSELPNGTLTLVTRLIGRLGNQMFLLASVYSTARDNDMVPMITDYQPLIEIFPNINVVLSPDEQPEKHYPPQGEDGAMKFTKTLSGLFARRRSIFLTGYLQCWRYFQHYHKEIREQLRFREDTRRKVDTFLQYVVDTEPKVVNSTYSSSLEFIGLHVRRGDVVLEEFRSLGYKPSDKDFILRAMNHFYSKNTNVVFIVTSDDITWCKQNLNWEQFRIVFSPFGISPADDMCLLATCNHTILGTGTFSWWGAWLADGEAVYMADYPMPDTWLGKQYQSEDFYLPHWKPL